MRLCVVGGGASQDLKTRFELLKANFFTMPKNASPFLIKSIFNKCEISRPLLIKLYGEMGGGSILGRCLFDFLLKKIEQIKIRKRNRFWVNLK